MKIKKTMEHAKLYMNYDESDIANFCPGLIRYKIDIYYKKNKIQSFKTKNINSVLSDLLNNFNEFTWKRYNLGKYFEYNKIKKLCGYPVKITAHKNEYVCFSVHFDNTKIKYSEVIEDFALKMEKKYKIILRPEGISTGCTKMEF